MILLQETTDWEVPNHTYLVSDDRSRVIGYIKRGRKTMETFSVHLPFSTRGRTFKVLKRIKEAHPGESRTVRGSKGDTYHITVRNGEECCSCLGFQYRGSCKHIRKLDA